MTSEYPKIFLISGKSHSTTAEKQNSVMITNLGPGLSSMWSVMYAICEILKKLKIKDFIFSCSKLL